jgi:hypothetical protein
MKLQRTTLFLLLSALALGGFVYFYEIEGSPKREAVKTAKQQLFSFKEDDIQGLTIYLDEETFAFERKSDTISGSQASVNPESSWQMKMPKYGLANQPSVAFLTSLLVQAKVNRSFTAKPTQHQEYGFQKPLATVKVDLKNQESYWLILGKPDFNRSFLYAQAYSSSKRPEELQVLLVPVDFEYAVNRPLSEWLLKEEKLPVVKPSPTPKITPISPTPKKTLLSPTPKTSQPSPTPKKLQVSPTPKTSQPSPTPKSTQPSPTPKKLQVSPTPKKSQPSPTPKKPQPSPSAKTSPS